MIGDDFWSYIAFGFVMLGFGALYLITEYWIQILIIVFLIVFVQMIRKRRGTWG